MKNLILIALLLLFQNNYGQNTPSNKILYYCSPCGCENDSKKFETGGKCPLCHMRLIQVGSFNYEMASVSNNGIIVYSSNKIDNKNLLFYKKLNSETSPVMIGEGSLPKISPQGDKIIYSKGDSCFFGYEIKINTTIYRQTSLKTSSHHIT